MQTMFTLLAFALVGITAWSLLLILPQFHRFAHWQHGGGPMSMRSRLILPLFPAACACTAFGATAGDFSLLLAVPFGLVVALILHWCYRSDVSRRRHVA